ncbi:hypothetical protein Tco_0052836 [Tanacetum coccineum]
MIKDADYQQCVELSLKMNLWQGNQGLCSYYGIREPDTRRLPSHFLEVQGKGKENIIDEHVANTLLDLNTPKKKSTANQYILQKRTPETAEPTGPSSQPEDEGITMTNSEMSLMRTPSSVSCPMTTLAIDLTTPQLDSPTVHQNTTPTSTQQLTTAITNNNSSTDHTSTTTKHHKSDLITTHSLVRSDRKRSDSTQDFLSGSPPPPPPISRRFGGQELLELHRVFITISTYPPSLSSKPADSDKSK